MTESDNFEVNRIKGFIKEQCEKAEGQLRSVAPDDIEINIHAGEDVADYKYMLISFTLDWPKLEDIGKQHTLLQSELTDEEFNQLIEIGGELEIKETLTHTFSPYLIQLQGFINEHS